MYICFRDFIGTVVVNVDDNGVSFAGSVACFTDTKGKDYTIETINIIQIGKTEANEK